MQQIKKNKKDNADTLRRNLEDKLPKNVRQIGNVAGNTKIYIQEFVLNYLKRKHKDMPQNGRKISHILVGEKKVAQKATYFFIIGAVELDIDVKDNPGAMSDADKKNTESTIQKYFGRENSSLCQIGWSTRILVEEKLPVECEGFHRENFGTSNTLFLGFSEDGEEIFYINENGKLKKQNGYYVYFERNQGMQQYAEDNQPAKCVEMEPIEKGKSEAYRMLLANHKEEIQHKHLITFLYTASTFLVMVVIVLGVTLINHYDKLKDMQEVIASLSKNVINGESQATYGVAQNAEEIPTGFAINIEATQPAVETTQAAIGLLPGTDMPIQNEAAQQAAKNNDAENNTDNNSENNADLDNNSESNMNTETKTDNNSENNANTETKTDNNSESNTNIETKTNNSTENNTNTETKTNNSSENNTNTESKTDNNSDNNKTTEQSDSDKKTAAQETLADSNDSYRSYEVKDGDTLIGICKKLYGSLEYLDEICEYNKINNSDEIKSGQRIWVP